MSPRPDYGAHVLEGNPWLSSAQHLRKGAGEPQTCFTRHIGSLHLIERGANMFPAWLRDEGLGLGTDGAQRRPNLSPAAQRYLNRLGLGVDDLFHHALAVLHDPAYREANAGALQDGMAPQFRCLAGPMATAPVQRTNSPPQLPGAASWPACWTRKRRCWA